MFSLLFIIGQLNLVIA